MQSHRSNGAWIGFNDLDTEGTFDWPNGTHVTFTKWVPEQPDTRNILMNEDHACVGMKFEEGHQLCEASTFCL